jgi:hypothetical protein
MAQKVEVVNGILSETLNGTTDFVVTGFGTVTAAVVFTSNSTASENPRNGAGYSVGFWDGTNVRWWWFI